jgi:two-component system chemotaxis sensor kinase CheA
MDGCKVKLNVEELAGAIVAAEADDAESVAFVCRMLEETEQAAKAHDLTAAVAEALGDVLTLGRAFAEKPSVVDLQNLAEATEQAQKQIARSGSASLALCTCHQAGAKPVVSAPANCQLTAVAKQRDVDTIALIGEFLSESEEGLSRADQILMAIEDTEASADSINSLFRVFHTIKGVAGFLELFDIQSLAAARGSMRWSGRAWIWFSMPRP